MQQINQKEFKDQEFYIGMDVHKKNWVITLRNNNMELKTFSMDPSPELLYKHLHCNYPGGRYISAYEAGFCGFWIHRSLESLGNKEFGYSRS